MRDVLEGLDPTAEAEVDPHDVAPEVAPEQEAAPEAATEAAPEAATEAAPDDTVDLGSVRRALEELEAAKARVQRDAERSARELREKLVADLLPVLDNLDRAIEAALREPNAAAFVEGLLLVRSQFAQVLGGYGLERIDAKGEPFDPNVHDAFSTVPVADPTEHNIVIDQITPGYRFGDRLLRAAKVVVGRHLPAA